MMLNREELSRRSFLVVRCFDRNAGFTALLIYALNGIRLAKEEGRIPVIYFDPEFAWHFYDPERGENVWNYYFESPGGLSYHELREALSRGDVKREQVRWLTSLESFYNHSDAPERIATFWNDASLATAEEFFVERRASARGLVREFIRVCEEIRSEAERKFEELTADGECPVWGVHIRGTDFNYSTPVMVRDYFDAIHRRVEHEALQSFRIILATDQEQFVELFENEFGKECILIQDCVRGRGTVAPFKLRSGSPYQKGREVLVDLLLLSQCDLLFKGSAAVGEAALWFNEELEVVDLTPPFQWEGPGGFGIKTAGVLTGAARRPLQSCSATWREFLERHIYGYAPVQGGGETLRRLIKTGQRWRQLRKEGYVFSDSHRLMANLTPRFLDFTEGPVELSLSEGKVSIREARASGELVCPSGLFSDGWTRSVVVMRLKTKEAGVVAFTGSSMSPAPIEMKLTLDGEQLSKEQLAPGEFRFEVSLCGLQTNREIVLNFDRQWQLNSPDERVVSVYLDQLEFSPQKSDL